MSANNKLPLQWFALLLTHQYGQCMLLTEKTSCVSASVLMVLRFNCTANRCIWLKYEISETNLSGAAYDSHADMFGNTAMAWVKPGPKKGARRDGRRSPEQHDG